MKMSKRFISLVLAVLMIISLCACNQNESDENSTTTAPQETVSADKELTLDTDVLEWVDFKKYNLDSSQKVKNVILMIGDGMGENTIKAAEIVKGDSLVMSGLPVTVKVKTNSLDGTTDSAASSTAMSCGIKTYNKYLGVDKDSKPVETMCEFAIAKGMKTGLAVTQILPHATPAGMVVHCDSRSMYNQITKQMINAGVDVMLGGGSQYYTKKIESMAKKGGYTYVDTPEGLQSADKDKKLLGMFSYANIIAGKTPSLATMTAKALDMLDNENGFFLMVEGSDIDVFASKLNMEKTLNEMMSFDKSVDVALSWAEKHPGTLVIVCADHETGGVKIPENATAKDITDSCFTSGGEHTSTNIRLMAGGAQSDKLFDSDVIENTDISKAIRRVLDESYGKKDSLLLNDTNVVGTQADSKAA